MMRKIIYSIIICIVSFSIYSQSLKLKTVDYPIELIKEIFTESFIKLDSVYLTSVNSTNTNKYFKTLYYDFYYNFGCFNEVMHLYVCDSDVYVSAWDYFLMKGIRKLNKYSNTNSQYRVNKENIKKSIETYSLKLRDIKFLDTLENDFEMKKYYNRFNIGKYCDEILDKNDVEFNLDLKLFYSYGGNSPIEETSFFFPLDSIADYSKKSNIYQTFIVFEGAEVFSNLGNLTESIRRSRYIVLDPVTLEVFADGIKSTISPNGKW